MTTTEFTKRQHSQIKKIELEKWLEGTRIKNDPGDLYVMHWIEENSQKFRTAWGCSLCRTCTKASECGFKTMPECSSHVADN